MEYKFWGIKSYDAVTYVEADNLEEATRKAKEQFERDTCDVQYIGHHWDEEFEVQTKIDGEYGDEEFVRPE
ncbi:MAG: hypothetical protein PHE15_02825 [Dehalococcoidales bacterium]|nr:hypothetical protein [Dehalococcoidales bacterium]